MSEIPQFSPGCFGSAITFKKDDMICKACVFAAQCEPMHNAAVAALRERYGIQTSAKVYSDRDEAQRLERERKAAELDAGLIDAMASNPKLAELPSKVREIVYRIEREATDVLSILRGANPFANSAPYLRLAAHLLLRIPAIDKGAITSAYMQKFGWKESTASAHSRMAIQTLNYFGVLSQNDGRLSLRKD